PQTVRQIDEIITSAGGRFVDASIIGPPPRKPGATRFYASGSHANDFAQLGAHGLDVRVLDGPVGQASAFKMCYAALTKRFAALATEWLTAADVVDVRPALIEAYQESNAMLWAQIQK